MFDGSGKGWALLRFTQQPTKSHVVPKFVLAAIFLFAGNNFIRSFILDKEYAGCINLGSRDHEMHTAVKLN